MHSFTSHISIVLVAAATPVASITGVTLNVGTGMATIGTPLALTCVPTGTLAVTNSVEYTFEEQVDGTGAFTSVVDDGDKYIITSDTLKITFKPGGKEA